MAPLLNLVQSHTTLNNAGNPMPLIGQQNTLNVQQIDLAQVQTNLAAITANVANEATLVQDATNLQQRQDDLDADKAANNQAFGFRRDYLDREYLREGQHALTRRGEHACNVTLEMVAVVYEQEFMDHYVEKFPKLKGYSRKRKSPDNDGRSGIGRITNSRRRRCSDFMDMMAENNSSMEQLLDCERTRVKRVIHQLHRAKY